MIGLSTALLSTVRSVDVRSVFRPRTCTLAIFFTPDIDSAKVAVERLQQDASAQSDPGPLDPWFAETSPDRTLRGALSNGRGEAPRIWQEMVGGDEDGVMEALRGATLDGRIAVQRIALAVGWRDVGFNQRHSS